jgi:hypothetical protein
VALARPGPDRAEPAALRAWLTREDAEPAFVGWAPRDQAGTLVAILERGHLLARPRPAPASFRAVAIVPVYNEQDIIAQTLRYLIDQGLEVYLLDNWSTDQTPELARRFLGQGVVAIERFPPNGASRTYDLRALMGRIEALAGELAADWFVLHDADERRRSPWPDVGLRDALYYVDQGGFNCVDHITLTFWPTLGSPIYDGTREVEQVLRHFEFSKHPGHFHQRRAWKQTGQRVSLAATAGHDVQFPGRRVFPYRFLLKHYPIRSQAHGERKVLAERLPRWNPAERAAGWHTQYDEFFQRSRSPSFVRDASGLTLFDPQTFYANWLIERLSGVGVFAEPPEWATPPVWGRLASAA